ncbi:MAG: 4-hydroxy-tetrahydrodipicolinate synthase [Elusimicrobiota bacterium]|nr:4-hydroxy-tetrahydrodipicolinate synthase [Elusimicrobiota bacterium]
MRFEGSYTALVTPFDADGRLDEETYRELVTRQVKNGTAGVVPCGSTGEAAVLMHEEYRRCVELACEATRGEIPVIAGVGTNATWKAVEMAREAESLGADALLVLAPYYNKPTQEGLYQHFRAVCRETRLPVMLYNIPGRTAVNVAPKTIARLAKDCPNLRSVKEAAGSLDQVSEILALAPRLDLLSGDDSLTIPMMSVGARGVVSVVSNVAPKETARLVDLFLKGKNKQAAALHLKLFPLIKALFVETNPIPVKAAMGLLGLCRPEPRLPLTPLSPENRAALKAALKQFGAKP